MSCATFGSRSPLREGGIRRRDLRWSRVPPCRFTCRCRRGGACRICLGLCGPPYSTSAKEAVKAGCITQPLHWRLLWLLLARFWFSGNGIDRALYNLRRASLHTALHLRMNLRANSERKGEFSCCCSVGGWHR